jgi:hypothetical protein
LNCRDGFDKEDEMQDHFNSSKYLESRPELKKRIIEAQLELMRYEEPVVIVGQKR